MVSRASSLQRLLLHRGGRQALAAPRKGLPSSRGLEAFPDPPPNSLLISPAQCSLSESPGLISLPPSPCPTALAGLDRCLQGTGPTAGPGHVVSPAPHHAPVVTALCKASPACPPPGFPPPSHSLLGTCLRPPPSAVPTAPPQASSYQVTLHTACTALGPHSRPPSNPNSS